MDYLKLIRLKHCIKNIIIFLPIVFGEVLFVPELFINCIIGFILFSFVAFSIYIINDIADIEKDRLHPKKKFRPLASGKIKKSNAIVLAICFIFLAIICCYIRFNIFALIILLSYFIINLLYSLKLKNIAILELFIVSICYILRVWYGSAITGVDTSSWLYLMVLSSALFFICGKRRNEIKYNGTRDVLKQYDFEFLDKTTYLFLGLLDTFYALWCCEKSSTLLFTVPMVFFISLKYMHDISCDSSDGDPVNVLLSDKWLIVLCIIYGVSIICVIYFFK